MKLLVAISVLVLVLAAHSNAEEEATVEQRFVQFQQQMQTLTDDIAEKTKTALEQFHTSDFAVKTKNFFTEQFEKLKVKMEETFPPQN